MSTELPRMDDHQPHGDPLHPVRDQAEGAEQVPGELQSQLDEVSNQNLAEVGPPGAGSPEASSGTTGGSTGAAKLQEEDEGPTAEGGGGLETMGGGGR